MARAAAAGGGSVEERPMMMRGLLDGGMVREAAEGVVADGCLCPPETRLVTRRATFLRALFGTHVQAASSRSDEGPLL